MTFSHFYFLILIHILGGELGVEMGSQQQMETMEVRKNYRNLWHTDLLHTIQSDTPYCCFALWWFSQPQVSSKMNSMVDTDICLVPDTHVVLVTCPAVVTVEKVNSLNYAFAPSQFFGALLSPQCGVGLLSAVLEAFMFVLQQLACIFSIIALIVGNSEIQQASRFLVCACMQTQHKIEMDKRDENFGPQSAMGVPGVQQMSRFDQAVPPFVGYAPYGQAYGH
ncbi:hypothetical protein Fmac_002025 [Flemingia macrophylla]|uniref:Uncharacterized protein n=1 Tax=Flemingia macrophylla TaxID=520843 RepID=A0ABD1NIR8_9FABA